MPKLPDISTLERPTPRPGTGVVSVPNADAVAQASVRFGQQLAGIGEMIDKQVERADTLRAEEAYNKLQEKRLDLTMGSKDGFVNVKNADVLNRPFVDDYTKRFEDEVKAIEQTLQSPRQREYFQKRAGVARIQYKGDLMRHMTQQADSWAEQTYKGIVETETRASIQQWNNPNAVATSLERIRNAVTAEAERNGIKGDALDNIWKKTESKVHFGVITQALDAKNVDYAMEYYKVYKDRLEPGEGLKIKGLIDEETALRVVTGAAREVVDIAFTRKPRIQNPDGTFSTERTITVEVDGRFFLVPTVINGKAFTPKQAERLWAEGKNVEVGSYATEAAANAAAQERTQLLGAGERGLPAFSAIDQALYNRFRDDPKKYRAARQEAQILYQQRERAIKEDEAAATDQALNWLDQNQGDFNRMPTSIRGLIPADKLSTVRHYGMLLAKGEERPSNMTLYGKFAQDPASLYALSDAQFNALRPELSDRDWQYFARERGQYFMAQQGQQSKNDPREINSAYVRQGLDVRLRGLGMDPTPKDTDVNGMQRVAAIRKFVNDSVMEAQIRAGKKFTDQELDAHIDGLFAKSVEVPASGLGKLFGFGPTNQRLMTLKVGDIPSEIKKRIEEDFKASGIEPTDGDILNAYMRLSAAIKRAPKPEAPEVAPNGGGGF